MSSVLRNLTKENFINLLDDSRSIGDFLTRCGLEPHGANYRTFWSVVLLHGLDKNSILEDFWQKNLLIRKEKGKLKSIPLTDILIQNSPYSITSSIIKVRLIQAGIMEDICVNCGVGDLWQGENLTLHLDHINGNNKDNRIENLRILCPNCHSQTQTFGGKKNAKLPRYCSNCGNSISRENKSGLCRVCNNKIPGRSARKVENRPTRETLKGLISDMGYEAVGRLYGVSSNSIRKWLK